MCIVLYPVWFLYRLAHLILKTILWSGYPHFVDEKMKAEKWSNSVSSHITDKWWSWDPNRGGVIQKPSLKTTIYSASKIFKVLL